MDLRKILDWIKAIKLLLEAYDLAKKKYFNNLQTMQNRILRALLLKKYRFSTDALHQGFLTVLIAGTQKHVDFFWWTLSFQHFT